MPFPDEFTDVYTTGTIAINNGSTALVGTGTYWVDNARAGDRVIFPNGTQCTIRSVDDEGEITLRTPYVGGNLSGAAYTIEYDYPYRVSGLDLARNATLIGQALLAAAVVFHFGTEAPDNSLGVDGQWGHREVGSSLLFYKKDAGEWGDPLSVASVYGDGGGIFDTNGNEQLLFGETASAVNNWKMTNAAASGIPLLSVVGGDTNISARYATKGTGEHIWQVNSADELKLSATALYPNADGGLNLGVASTNRFANGYFTTDVIAGGSFFARSGSDGYLKVTTGSSTLTGYIAWHLAAGTRLGYMGSSATNVVLGLENSALFQVTGGRVAVSDTTASISTITGSATFGGGVGVAGSLYVGGSRIHQIVSAAQGTPTLNSEVSIVAQANAATGSWAAIAIIGGQTGKSWVYFGDKDSASSGAIDYDHNTDTLSLRAGGSTRGYFTLGFVVGAPTGGDRGAGTINTAADIYKNNSAYTNPDYVFEHFYNAGKIERFADKEGAAAYRGLMALDALRDYTRENLRLPGLDDEPKGIFARADLVLEKFEELTLYTLDLHDSRNEHDRDIKRLSAENVALRAEVETLKQQRMH